MARTKVKTYQYSFSGKLVDVYDCISDTGKHGFNVACVQNCMLRDKINTHKGFIWSNRELTPDECAARITDATKKYYEHKNEKSNFRKWKEGLTFDDFIMLFGVNHYCVCDSCPLNVNDLCSKMDRDLDCVDKLRLWGKNSGNNKRLEVN